VRQPLRLSAAFPNSENSKQFEAVVHFITLHHAGAIDDVEHADRKAKE
jgi:hypothetical protein